MTLRGPAHPDTFRVQVGRYGDRYYHDPLPADGTWPATDDQWPSVSIVKNAWPKQLGPWMAQEAARFAVEHRDTWTKLPEDAAIDMIAKASDRTRNKAADRGTGVHTILEGIAEGREPHPELMPDVAPYLPVLRQLVADLQPEWVYSEVVCISRSLGYGGTADAAIRINAGPLVGTYGVDWKSRKAGRHDAHRDECAQLAAYSRCDYIIAEVDGQAVRMAPPALDGGLIVSITPDDYRLYPVDLDAAWATWVDLREFHDTTKATIRGKHVVIPRRPVDAATVNTTSHVDDPFAGIDGGKVPPAAAPPAGAVVEAATPAVCSPPPVSLASQARIDWCRDRLVALVTAHPNAGIVPPEGVPTFRQAREDGHRFTDDEIDAWCSALVEPEAEHTIPFPTPDPGRSDTPQPPAPEPVPPAPAKIAADDPRLASLATRVNALPPDLLAMFEAEAVTARRLPKFHRGHGTETQLAEAIAILEPLEEAATARRLRIDLSLSLLSAHGVEPIRALRLICDRDASRLNEWEAESLDDLACAVAGGVLVTDGTNVVASEGAETTLLNHVGELAGTKTAGRRDLLAVARNLAGLRQLPAAGSTEAVLASPLLVAAVAMTDTLPASAA